MSSEFPPLSPYELAAAGQALFGAGWRNEIARVLGVSEGEVTRVELGLLIAPADWRAKLIARAQDNALRAMETASNLLCYDAEPPPPNSGLGHPLPRYA